tara:strand:+ start:2314 stop:2577 length:264 start_codon:yes stop_codon:yes gene_type:complete
MKKSKFLQELRTVIREEIRNEANVQPTWLRSSQVREMLNISDSTLQTLRVNGTIPAYKLGASWMYKYDEIVSVLEANRTNGKEVPSE